MNELLAAEMLQSALLDSYEPGPSSYGPDPGWHGRGSENPLELGTYSGNGLVPRTGSRVPILRTPRKSDKAIGLATVSVNVSGEDVQAPNANTNAKLVLDVIWSSGRGGGRMLVDATAGSCFTLGAADAISIDGYLESSVDGETLVAERAERVEVAVCWGGSSNPKPAFYTSPTVALDGVNDSAYIAVPSQAKYLLALTRNPNMNASLTAVLTRTNLLAVRDTYRQLNPAATSVVVVHGSRFLRWSSTFAGEVTALWELWT